jgi:hypothetical protein
MDLVPFAKVMNKQEIRKEKQKNKRTKKRVKEAAGPNPAYPQIRPTAQLRLYPKWVRLRPLSFR